MKNSLHVLMVEDSDDDTTLLLRELRRNGYELVHRRVETAEAMRDALHSAPWDLIQCDYNMPSFSATAALRLSGESGLDLPFIIVSGTVTEEEAVDALKAGAHDFTNKDRLARPIPAIERELNAAQRRKESKRAERRLAAEHAVTRVLAESATLADATPRLLAAICESLEWDLGAICRSERAAWSVRDPDPAGNRGARHGRVLQPSDSAA